MLVGLSGGALGVLIARWGVDAIVALAPAAMPRSEEIRIDIAVLIFSLCVSLLAALLFGPTPPLPSARVAPREPPKASRRGSPAGGRRVRDALVSSEVALALV